MARRQAWIRSKNVCVLYRVTTEGTTAQAFMKYTLTQSWQNWDICLCSGLTEAAEAEERWARAGWGSQPERRIRWPCVRLKKYARHWPDETRKSFQQLHLCLKATVMKWKNLELMSPYNTPTPPRWTWSHVLITIYVRWWYKASPLIHLCWTMTINLP